MNNTEEQDESSGGNYQSTARSYECTFCKRGFTNAQALGGHMNIHRKHKAKLKQSTTTQTSASASSSLPWIISPTPAEGHGRSGGGENTNLIISEETLIGHEVRQLPLFVENPSNIMDKKLEIHQDLPGPEVVTSDRMIRPSSFQHGSRVSELDLELRLGPEPQNESTPSSATTGSTRHFF